VAGAAGYDNERSLRRRSSVVAEDERELSLQDVEGFFVLTVNMRRGAFADDFANPPGRDSELVHLECATRLVGGRPNREGDERYRLASFGQPDEGEPIAKS
jgi:hypothetical protein